MDHSVLLVDDSEDTYAMMRSVVGNGVHLIWAETLASAWKIIGSEMLSLILLDIELPDGNGIDLCSQLYGRGVLAKTPIFFLTSHGDLSERVMGFTAGADDYIVKPFVPIELRARIEAKLRKVEAQRKHSNVLKWKEIEINRNRQEVQILTDAGVKKVDLTSLEFKLLLYFAANAENVLSRDEVLDEIWGKDVHVYSRSVDTHVSKLRKKLGAAGHVIKSVHGSGYRFCPSPLN